MSELNFDAATVPVNLWVQYQDVMQCIGSAPLGDLSDDPQATFERLTMPQADVLDDDPHDDYYND